MPPVDKNVCPTRVIGGNGGISTPNWKCQRAGRESTPAGCWYSADSWGGKLYPRGSVVDIKGTLSVRTGPRRKSWTFSPSAQIVGAIFKWLSYRLRPAQARPYLSHRHERRHS
jgi:hypothetical protein